MTGLEGGPGGRSPFQKTIRVNRNRRARDWTLSLIALGLAATLTILVGRALAIAPDVATPDVAQTPSPVTAPTLKVLDVRTFLPATPPGFGQVANHLLFFSDGLAGISSIR